MIVVPADIPLTNPLLDTEATDVLLDTHGVVVAAVGVPVNCVVDPTQTEFEPVMVGLAFTVTVVVAEQLLLFV